MNEHTAANGSSSVRIGPSLPWNFVLGPDWSGLLFVRWREGTQVREVIVPALKILRAVAWVSSTADRLRMALKGVVG